MYTKEQLDSMTKNELVDLAREQKIAGIVHKLNKPTMVDELYTKLQTKEEIVDNEKVAIQLFNNIYYPKTGRLTVGVHLLSKEVVQELTNKLSGNVVKILDPQEVAAYYGLNNGDST